MKRSIVFSAAFGLCACSTITDLATGIDSSYPTTWPTVSSESDECPNLTGRYNDFGDYSYRHDSYANSLAYRILGSRALPHTVFLKSDGYSLSVEVWIDDELLQTKYFSQKSDEIRCANGAVWFPPVIETGADGTGGYRAKQTLGLRLANNGNLIGEAKATSVGAVIWVIPIAGSQTIWYQWNSLSLK